MMYQILSYFKNRLFKKKIQKQAFKQIMSVANDIAQENPQALVDYIRLLGRKIQSEYMCKTLSFSQKNSAQLQFHARDGWFSNFEQITEDGKTLGDLQVKSHTPRTVSLAKDVVLPWPWNNDRLVNALSHIGSGKPATYWNDGDTSWIQDSNHQIKFYTPVGISFVGGGNHSITSGIVQAEGFIYTDAVYDISPSFEHVYCDGLFFYRNFDHKKIQSVVDLEFAAIFEIGKIMHKLGVSA